MKVNRIFDKKSDRIPRREIGIALEHLARDSGGE
jgi:hypothetical protein